MISDMYYCIAYTMMVTAPQRAHHLLPGVRSRLRARGQARCQDGEALAHLHLCL